MKTNNQKFVILPDLGEQVEVSNEVYRCMNALANREHYHRMKVAKYGNISLEALDPDGCWLTDESGPTLEEGLEKKEQIAELYHALDMIPKDERALIQLIYFEGMSESAVSRKLNIPQKTINNRHKRILLKLSKMLKK